MKDLKYGFVKQLLEFRFEAKTSRGAMTQHNSYLIWVMHPSNLGLRGWGEAAPLPGLSPEANEDFEDLLHATIELLNEGHPLYDLNLLAAPSIQFGVETAQLDLWNGGNQILFENPFSSGQSIPINGLVWMDEIDHMLVQAEQKVNEGYTTLKFKIGAHDFDLECKMLESFRKKFSPAKVEIRLDANGAFEFDDALLKLNDLKNYLVHSIEQPIKAGNPEAMAEICGKSSIPIALDEELIGLNPETQGKQLLTLIKPAYLILKPTLLGGLGISAKWVRKAEDENLGWWATSALESNIGLNAIAQWVSVQKNKLPQGLGTGNLYKNNIVSPLLADKGSLYYLAEKHWKLTELY